MSGCHLVIACVVCIYGVDGFILGGLGFDTPE